LLFPGGVGLPGAPEAAKTGRFRQQSRQTSHRGGDRRDIHRYIFLSDNIGPMGREGNQTPHLLSGLGGGLLLAMAAEGAYVLLVSNPLGSVWIAGIVTSLPFALGLLYAGYWLPDSAIAAGRYARVGYWCVGGLVVFLAINGLIMATMPPESGFRLVSWGRWAATLGAGIGSLVGVFEARAIERAVAVERERVRAEEAEAREDFFAYLNATLRHEVLNAASVVLGQADLAAAECGGEGTIPDRMETIKTRTREMEGVIEDVRVLLQASRDGIETKPVEITDLLAAEIATLRDGPEPVVVETEMPERAVALGNQPLRRAFANLLQNAVEHNDSERPTVEVTVTQSPETVVVRIADDGPGVPAVERDGLFDREIRHDSNHGLGLALTKTLVESYDGTIELSETGPDGTIFTVELPRHPDPPDGGTEPGSRKTVAGIVE
jgi:two-component system OmpR family sensor kinase